MLRMRALCLTLLLAGGFALRAEGADEPLPPSKLKPVTLPDMVERLRPLYSLTVDQPPAGGKESKLTVQEKQRNARTSVVAYNYISGPSVGTSMTAMFGIYRIALDRGAKFFVVCPWPS
jgi:hypothetical protein